MNLGCIKWLDCFRICKFLKLLGHVMVLLVVGLVAYTYYTVVCSIYGPLMVHGSGAQRVGSAMAVVAFSALVSRTAAICLTAATVDPPFVRSFVNLVWYT